MKRITIMGDGGWGTALALRLHQAGCRVILWGPFPEVVAETARQGENRLYLPGVPLPAGLTWTADPAVAVREAELVVLAVPSKYCRDVYRRFAGLLPEGCPLLNVSKGLDMESGRRLTELAADFFPAHPVAALSGPSHAEEVAREMPTAVVVAAVDQDLATRVQAVFTGPRFRVYTSDDLVGTELGGAFKNVMAIAVGAGDGLGFGDNTRAALITRGLAEMTRLGCALGARPETFAGLSGMGDLIVTCTSKFSRNRAVGERLGRGESIEQITAGMTQVAEGVTTCATALRLGRESGVRTPIIDEVHALIHEGKSPRSAVQSLLEREARPELD
ncbi:MAG: NAD(P)H-dependent glycerol-3-phosphate dehydrogenase [Kiritimatiellia bacterium]|nr:NAD(P)-dependent glycerol-3-phosphate dehydrogenase [Lentisphaerota bacterium]